jgi:hypothetical protein
MPSKFCSAGITGARIVLLLGTLLALGACQGGGSDSGSSSSSSTTSTASPSSSCSHSSSTVTTTDATNDASLPTISGGSTSAALWAECYFVTAYDMAKVMAQRTSAVFTNSTIRYTNLDTANPNYPPSKVTTSNALLDAHLDYAFSTGLTGKGVTLGMIDSEVNPNHVQFSGKSVTLKGATGTAADHGTAVASVMVGNGSDDQMIGFAPGASLIAGTIDYSSGLDWTKVGQYMLDAKAAGAVAVNNSWGLSTSSGGDETVASANAQPGGLEGQFRAERLQRQLDQRGGGPALGLSRSEGQLARRHQRDPDDGR